MRLPLLLSAVLLASACALGPSRQAESLARYDFGPPPALGTAGNPVNLRDVAVRSPVWLESAGLQYRLAYADAAQRQSYAHSRWVAPPRQLMEQMLQRALGAGAGANGGCRLHIELDEFLHLFEQPATSFGVLEARVMLFAPRPERLVAQRGFSVREPAPTPDARGGVAALGAAAAAFARELRAWLGALDRGGEPGLNSARACRGG